MNRTILSALFAATIPFAAAQATDGAADALAGAFFPPELIVQAHEQIGMSQEQLETFRARVDKTHAQFDDLRQRLGREGAALAALAKQERVDEAKLIAQLDKVLDAEREAKHLQMSVLATIKNLLTSEQQAKLREMMKAAAAKRTDELHGRLTTKVQSVQAGVQKWTESGRDPSPIVQTMNDKIKPLLDGGKPAEAEAELDRLLEQLKQEQK
jgi:Spy/CpxP family protein refolding chaperone